ncbi:adoMet-dependent rRNA methyltransferase spb1 [Cryptomeria japonica]|uniref:adoMet-dependent rRNA methyltransferase spb1 n=1 Tax=Cryptomeria japonica TaxID=3369 RepID=UPI0025ACB542|nr:adoMet-dependent rRNA methyltransferase spb1 [Cryptomeria japonica]XP_057819945.1 adoMet-dependent rRNA methyltransferase spb1 [Cryptomeria japonica]XP_057819946.1 adoMet-dependent rRNA methyltransferase spb1 [Cryptomeria japonica]
MGKPKGKHRLDKFYHLAKEQGYRSRAAFKIVQLDAKFNFFSSARSLLDLCAAPGGWMQVAVKHMPVGSLIIGVDLVPIRPIRGAFSLQEDITTPKCKASIRKLMKENGCNMLDVVLHDGSPNVGGAWSQEATTQASLVVDSLRLAVEFLAPKGTFVSKVFRSQDYNALLYCFKQLFEKVEVTKPVASRSTSAEIYIVGLRYKAPAKIDPRLLDVRHLFQQVIDPPKVVDVLRATKQKRNREGYEEGLATTRKTCLASDFVWSDKPLEVLGSVTSISFEDPACSAIKENSLTTDEIKILCDDLRVLGKQDFKHILKWRLHIRKALSPKEKLSSLTKEVEKAVEGNDDERMLNEMEELHSISEQKKKKAKKLVSKRRAKAKARTAMGMKVDATEDGYMDEALFSLASIKAKRDLQALDSPAQSDDENGFMSEDEAIETNQGVHSDSEASDIDSDEERKRYDEQLETVLDQAYERYVTAKEGSTKQRKRAKLAMTGDDSELWKKNEADDQKGVDEEDDSDYSDKDGEANPLVVPLSMNEQPSQEQLTSQWFSQDVFAGFEDTGEKYDVDSDMSEDDKDVASLQKLSVKTNGNKKGNVGVQSDSKFSPNQNPQQEKEDDFEIVPAVSMGSSDESSSEDESDYDTDSKAEILAFAKKMLRKKQRENILDASYNRYTFDDKGLPEWFAADEKQHSQPQKPITKEEIEAMKAQFKEIDARPAKKVAEAKARKKRVAMKKLEAVRNKANAISNQTDISNLSKNKMIERLYKKAMPKRPQKEYVVAKKGVQVKPGKGKVLVDPRMKKDSRSTGIGRHGKNKNMAKKGKGGKRPAKAGTSGGKRPKTAEAGGGRRK